MPIGGGTSSMKNYWRARALVHVALQWPAMSLIIPWHLRWYLYLTEATFKWLWLGLCIPEGWRNVRTLSYHSCISRSILSRVWTTLRRILGQRFRMDIWGSLWRSKSERYRWKFPIQIIFDWFKQYSAFSDGRHLSWILILFRYLRLPIRSNLSCLEDRFCNSALEVWAT